MSSASRGESIREQERGRRHSGPGAEVSERAGGKVSEGEGSIRGGRKGQERWDCHLAQRV